MADAEFNVTFRGQVPEPLKVGDYLRLNGMVTVRSIEADLVDVTLMGSKGTDVVMGDLKVELFSNLLEVWRG